MASGLSDLDWQRLDQKFNAIHQEIKDSGSKVHKLDKRVQTLEEGGDHKCSEVMEAHVANSYTHNPKKAIGLFAGISAIAGGIGEAFHAFFHKSGGH